MKIKKLNIRSENTTEHTYILQKNKEIKEEQENKDTDVLHTAAEYYSENIKAENNLEKEKKRNISIDAVGPNENMIVDN